MPPDLKDTHQMHNRLVLWKINSWLENAIRTFVDEDYVHQWLQLHVQEYDQNEGNQTIKKFCLVQQLQRSSFIILLYHDSSTHSLVKQSCRRSQFSIETYSGIFLYSQRQHQQYIYISSIYYALAVESLQKLQFVFVYEHYQQQYVEYINSLNLCYQSDNLYNLILLMQAFIIIYLLALTISTNCQFWYYSYEYHDESFYTCYRQQSNTNSLALALILNADSTISNYSLQNVANAKSAGLTLTALFQPCRNIPAETHLQNLNKAFPFKVMDKYWLELRVGAGDCGWDIYPPFGNCYFLQDLIVKIQNQLNSAVGIVTDRETWYKIFKDYQGCPDISGYADLWWIPTAASPQPNFDDFVKIGGWYRPFTKLQTTKSFCSATFYQNFYTPF